MSKENNKDHLTQPLSGFRDILAEQMLPREEMISTIRGVYERYGFTPLDTPAIERKEVLTGKYGDESEKLIYSFTDHGNRDVALRFDLTVPLARVILEHQHELNLPYKRYQIGKVWRGERPGAGRYREFVQFDADVVGSSSAVTDAEIVAMMADAMEELGVNAVVRVNNRKILDALAEKSKIEEESDFRSLLGSIDKFEKIGEDQVIKDINEYFGSEISETVERYLNIEGESIEQKLDALNELLGDTDSSNEGVSNLRKVMTMLNRAGYGENQVILDPTIARGLDYYTGIIYETTLVDNPRIGSVCSGGRYDNLIEDLGGPSLPAVGTSIGVDRLFTALEESGKLKKAKTPTELLITSFDEENTPEYFRLATLLRKARIPVEIYPDSDVNIGKQVKYAHKQGIPYVAFMGSKELEENVVSVKNMDSGDQEEITEEELAKKLKK